MAGINRLLKPLRRMDLKANPNGTADLIEGKYTSALLCRLSGAVSSAAGDDAGALVAEGVERLVKSVRVKYDGFHLVNPIQGRELRALTRRMVANIPAADRLTDAAAQAGTPISTFFIVPFARPYLGNPFETVLPPLKVDREFSIEVELADELTNAGSARGSGALITGGTNVVTFDSLGVEVVQEYSDNGRAPKFVPVISIAQSDQFSAANAALDFELRQTNRWDGVLFHTIEGATTVNADLLNKVTMLSGSTRYLDGVPIEILSAMEQSVFPATGSRAPGESDETGYDFFLAADNGKLGNAVDPRLISQPQFQFDVDAPNDNPAQIRAIFMELMTQPGVTEVQ